MADSDFVTGALDSVIGLMADIGDDIQLVQGAGGNVSLKDDVSLWVKASGTWLADARKRQIFVHLDLPAVRAALIAGSEDFSAAIKSQSGLRPSIETSLHALMPQRVVVHVHSINALAWAVRKDGKLAAGERLRGLAWAWVAYVRPGMPLTRAVTQALAASPDTRVLLLANHGLVIAADTTEEARVLLDEVERRLRPTTSVSVTSPSMNDVLIPPGCRLPVNSLTHRLASKDFIQWLDGALYPDHVVFLGNTIPVLGATSATGIEGLVNSAPYCVAIADSGIILGGKCSAGAEAMLECLALLAPTLPEKDSLSYLTEEEVAELSDWDAEKARQKIDRALR